MAASAHVCSFTLGSRVIPCSFYPLRVLTQYCDCRRNTLSADARDTNSLNAKHRAQKDRGLESPKPVEIAMESMGSCTTTRTLILGTTLDVVHVMDGPGSRTARMNAYQCP
jgi:hypothetical protein